MSKVKQIILLRNNGIGLKAIAKAVGISRNTVKKYLRLIEVKGYDPQMLLNQQDHQVEALFAEPDQTSLDRYKALEAMFPYIQSELRRTGVNRWLLWGEYKQKHPDGYSYAHFCAYLRTWMMEQSATMHFEHKPGDRLYIDFAGKKLFIVDKETGELKKVEVYVATLGYSQLTYVEAVVSQKKEDFIMATQNALQFFGGVPRVLIPDNLKSAVHKANKYEAELNESFRDFANHYQTSVLPARSYKPRDKSPVEKAVNIIYTRIYAPLRNQVFYTIEDLNKAISELLEEHNQKHFQREPVSRRDKFEQYERSTLAPLPAERYEIKQYKWVTAMKNCHIHLSEDKHYYSIPFRYIGRKVKLIYSDTIVSVFYNKQRIAFHKRDRKRFGYTTIREHLPSTHQFVSEWNPDKFIRWASAIDEKVKEYIERILESKTYPEQAYRSCVGVLSQEKIFGRKRFIKAVERASYYQAYNYKIVERILKGQLEMLDLPDQEEKQISLPFHKNTRGADYYN